MSTQFYTALQTQATDLLTLYGASMTIEGATGRSTVKGVFVNKKQKREQDGVSSLLTTQREVVVQGNVNRLPVVGDTLTFNKIVYTITEVEDVSPTSTTIVYKLLVDY